MKLNTLLTLNAIVALLFAIAALVIPSQLLTSYGLTTDAVGLLMTRYFGAVLLGITTWSWLGRRIQDADLRRAIIIVQIIPWLGVLVMDGWALVIGANALEWVNILLALLFLAAYGYCWTKPVLQTA